MELYGCTSYHVLYSVDRAQEILEEIGSSDKLEDLC